MKGTGFYGSGGPIDLGTVFDEIFEAARNFQDEFRKNFNPPGNDHPHPNGHHHGGHPHGNGCGGRRHEGRSWVFDDNTDYYPGYSYPPMNVFMTSDRSMIFEFALAGFDEKDISLTFQGDYMVFSAALPPNDAVPDENIRYFKRRLKMKNIDRQKYFVPLDKYAQESVKAVFRNGILRVTIPPKEEQDQSNGIKIEIVSED